MFKIITPVYNSEAWIGQCIASVKWQKGAEFEHIIVDDCSTDDTVAEAKRAIDNDPRFKLVTKLNRAGVMHSHVTGIKILKRDGDEEDIYVHLDGDDWLYHEYVLLRVEEEYEDSECWLTYGNYVTTNRELSVCRLTEFFVPRNEILHGWPFSHLRTFKKFLWDRVEPSALLDKDGKPFTSACDVAIMIPMIEMAGPRVSFIDETLYIYNRDNPLNEDKVGLDDQVRCALDIVNKKPYEQYNPVLS